ncbi:dihydrodipicolinate synthase family protein [Nonomuraea sediminis]|uniref:dihydrodipicolinate synthase family protein n=1 Tax=Nonomuraea sediminis TaxID=2835864 RepID=UPI001BDD1FC5|nr:dihydrodipicolinate synthase family protein [Nonomuraea sediminis]
MDSRAEHLRDSLRGALIAAAATPMTASGEVSMDVASRYYAGLLADGADALAVLAHTGRGPYLAPDVRAGLIERAVALGAPVLVGVDGPGQARVAKDLGAHGVLVFPFGDRLSVHEAIWRGARMPMIAFDLYTRPCPPDVLRELAAHPGVAGVKAALLSDAMACQQTIAITRAAGRLAITGEDRMFAASLLWGCEAALVGLAAAHVPVTADVMRAYAGGDLRAFEKAAARLDALAATTFIEPMEGYVQRMLTLAAQEGRIPATHAHDPHCPPLTQPG